MHLINRSFLKLALLPAGLYRRMGVNTTHLKVILTTKLTLDDRRPQPLAQASRTKESKPPTLATLGTMFMSLLMGGFFLFCFFVGSDKVTQLTLYFTFFFVLLSLTLITDFTSVLIDVRDNLILLPKPVNDKTVVMARLLHIFIHLCKIIVPMGLPGMVLAVIQNGVYAAVILLLLIFLLSAFSIFFINAVYIAILKFTTPQRFQSIITYLQIVFAILVYGSYQVFPRLMTRFEADGLYLERFRGIAFYPIYWFANSWQLLYSFGGSPIAVITGIAGLLFPLLCIYGVVRYLAPAFNRKLSLLSGTESSSAKTSAKTKRKKGSFFRTVGRLMTSGTVEKASFHFTLNMMARSRDFKLKVYPGIGYLVVYAALVLFRSDNLSLSLLREQTPGARLMLLSGVYLTVFLLASAIAQMAYSDKYKASWIYFTSPVAAPGHIVTGALKAVLSAFLLPAMIVISAVALWFGGLQTLPNLVLGWCNVVLIVSLLLYFDKHQFPFASALSTNAKGGNFLKGLLILAVAGVICLVHFLVYSFLAVVVICTALSALACWLIIASLRQISWSKVLSGYAD